MSVPYVIENPSGGVDVRTNRTVSASETLPASDQVVFANAAGGAIVLTLPSPASYKFRTITIKKVDATANTVTITSSGTIDGSPSIVLTSQYQSVNLYCDGTNWSIV